MKNTMMTALILSTISLSALAKDSAGQASAGKVANSTLLSISGAAAKKIFKTLAMKGDFIKLNSNTVGTLKSSPEIACLNVSGVDAYQCKILLASNGRAEQLKSFSVTPKTSQEALSIEAGGMNDYVNVKIVGEAAQLIMENLKGVKTTSVRHGSLITTVKMGDSIQCSKSAEVAVVTTCRFSVTANGNVEANFAR